MSKLPGSNNRAGAGETSLCLNFRAILHCKADVIFGKDCYVVDHAVPETGIVFLNRTFLLFEQVEVVADGLTAGALVVNGGGDFVKPSLCFFVAGGQSLVALFVFGLVLLNVGVLVNAVLNLPGDKVDLKGKVILLFFKRACIEGCVFDGSEGLDDVLPVGENLVCGTLKSCLDLVIRQVRRGAFLAAIEFVVTLSDYLPVLAG